MLLYTADVARAEAFYTQLGFKLRRHSRSGGWTELEWGGVASSRALLSRTAPTGPGRSVHDEELLLFLHHAQTLPSAAGRFQLGFEAQEPLETLTARLIENGVIVAAEIVDEGFGRVLNLQDPDGNTLIIIEHEPELYT